MSASAVSTSMIFPLPSSPHCAPIKMVLAMETINCPDASGSDTFGTAQNDRMSPSACKEFRLSLPQTGTYSRGMRTILLIILILLLVGAYPGWGYASGWGYYPFGGIGLVLLI